MTNKALFVRSKVPDVEALQNEGSYSRILELDFDDMIPFVLSNIKKKGLMSWLFIAINVIGLFSIGVFSIWGIYTGWIPWFGFIKQLFLGILAGSIIVIPFHELLHGLAYKIIGAKKIKFGANLQQFFFFVSTDRFPVNRKELYFLALLPFGVLNLVLLMVALFWLPQYSLLFGFLLLSHNLMCIGDFAITNYVMNEKEEVFTYDEPENKKSYFYKTAKSNLL
jgi:hypothetical protein